MDYDLSNSLGIIQNSFLLITSVLQKKKKKETKLQTWHLTALHTIATAGLMETAKKSTQRDVLLPLQVRNHLHPLKSIHNAWKFCFLFMCWHIYFWIFPKVCFRFSPLSSLFHTHPMSLNLPDISQRSC